MLTPPPQVADFGLSRGVTDTTRDFTQNIGTIAYMPPEALETVGSGLRLGLGLGSGSGLRLGLGLDIGTVAYMPARSAGNGQWDGLGSELGLGSRSGLRLGFYYYIAVKVRVRHWYHGLHSSNGDGG